MEHVLEFLLTINHSEEADNPVLRSVSNLVVHIIDTHIDQIQDLVTKIEMDLDSVELDLDKAPRWLLVVLQLSPLTALSRLIGVDSLPSVAMASFEKRKE
ncbi:hypothetical protein PIB30_045227 [Stylosanthes scabra]|uniref:Uncharacterized protein n=1 Tax=Stylosanthes scabra TaxID=79078 RepID=A0ABU6UFC0_9FABA|nr:hypothetical protein [Stylosanthes scabra]